MISSIINNIIRVGKALNQIRKLGVEKSLKKEIFATYFRVFILNRYDSKNRSANLMGKKVNFCNYGSLALLYQEIVLNQEYFFATENESPYIIDCGSNIGISVLYFKMLYPNSTILAFEPDEDAFSCLYANVKNNDLHSVTMNKIALSNKEGMVDFYYNQNHSGSLHMSLKQERMPKQKRLVAASLLSKYIDREIDLLKMDVEGAELEVIEELSEADKLKYIRQMVIEYHHHINKDTDAFSQALCLLETAGFGYQIESRLGRPFVSQKYQDILIYAYRKNPTVQRGIAMP